MAKRDPLERLIRAAATGSESALAGIEREVIARGEARYYLLVVRDHDLPAPSAASDANPNAPAFPGAKPVVAFIPGAGRRGGFEGWLIPVVTISGFWAAMTATSLESATVSLWDSKTGSAIPFGDERAGIAEGITVEAARALDFGVAVGIWTPHGDVLCLECHGPTLRRGPGSERIKDWDRLKDVELRTLPPGAGVASCDLCDRKIYVDEKVALEHELADEVSRLLEGDGRFAVPPARMEQTGGMNSAFSVTYADDGPRLLVVHDEEEDGVFLAFLDGHDIEGGGGSADVGRANNAADVVEIAKEFVDLAERKRYIAREGH